ncbi:MAG: phosphoadenosine phosphosulfate reductase family protein [Lyngbya sp. HA4199-MV5]|jgi:DNA sulfur modification protein DndC|nr:phosphoadenosine phosphosulfate reductase family protein [Lyngbya sp. HA4199-MV5]
MRNLSLFDVDRLTLPKAIDLTVQSLNHYGQCYKHWAVSFSGGKDSTATVTVLCHLIESGQVNPPESLTVLYADTLQELPPLHLAALNLLSKLRDRGIATRVVKPDLDHRYFVYICGRGVPPPSNVFRWCTPKLKVMSMEQALEALRQECGEKLLMLTGVRVGESAVRDQRIAVSCTKDGGECGQGWFQQSSVDAIADTLAPILHWRVCHVWDWLTLHASELGFDTWEVAAVYGMHNIDGEEPLNARTGCFGCPLVQKDSALERLCQQPDWVHLTPLLQLRSLYWEVHKPEYRHRQPPGERRKDGKLAAKQNRLGPLTLSARRWLLGQLLEIEAEVNRLGTLNDRPHFELIGDAEIDRIRQLIQAKTYPNKWSGTEPRGDALLEEIKQDGSVQKNLFAALSL